MGAPEPLHRGWPTVIGRPSPGEPAFLWSGQMRSRPLPVCHWSKGRGELCRAKDGRKETEVLGILATEVVPAYVVTNNDRDEQLFPANEKQDWKVEPPALLRVLEKASARASPVIRDVM